MPQRAELELGVPRSRGKRSARRRFLPQRIRAIKRAGPRSLLPLFQSGVRRRLRGREVTKNLSANLRLERPHPVLRLHACDGLVPPFALLVACDNNRRRMTRYTIRENVLTARTGLQFTERADVCLIARGICAKTRRTGRRNNEHSDRQK